MRTVVLACAIFCPIAAEAQDFGIKGGISSATLSFAPESGSPDLTDIRARRGFVGGIVVLMPGNSAGGWQIEAVINQKGARNLLRQDDAIRLTYVEVPFLLHLDVFQADPFALYVIAGPFVAFNVQASYEDEGTTENIRDDVRKLDLGLQAGGGIEYGPLSVDGRYTWGLRSAFQDGDLEGSFKNRTFTVTAGIRFGR